MSTDIKPGQVWAWNADDDGDEAEFRITAADANRVRYEYLSKRSPSIEGGFIHTPATIREQCRLVKDVDATPAPLDPSKVAITLKAGDYIEAESDGTKIGGPVSHVNENGFVSIQHLGTFAIEGITPPRAGYREFALTDHQPAPEPEPEYEPATVATADVWTERTEQRLRVFRIPGAWVDEHGEIWHDVAPDRHVSEIVPDEDLKAVEASWLRKNVELTAARDLVQRDLSAAEDEIEAAYSAAAPDLDIDDRTESLAVVVERLRKAAEVPFPNRGDLREAVSIAVTGLGAVPHEQISRAMNAVHNVYLRAGRS